MAELQHPHIAKVLEPPREEDHWHFFVLPYFPSGDLRAAVLEHGLDSNKALGVLLDAALGLSHAHTQGLIHRDVSPSNILLSASNVGIVTDFDLVYANDTTGGTRTGAMGKFLYVAPEALQDSKNADEVSDSFSIGMTALFCCTRSDLTPAIWKDPNEAIKSLPVGRYLKRVLRRATAWERDERYQSVSEFRSDLKFALDVPDTPIRPRSGNLGKGIRVLVVDDERLIRDVVSDFLRIEGFEVDAAPDRPKTLELIQAQAYNVIFLDLKIPEVKGTDLLREVRKLRPKANVIMMTGFGAVEVAVECMKCGARDFLLKPFRVEEIVKTAHEWGDS